MSLIMLLKIILIKNSNSVLDKSITRTSNEHTQIHIQKFPRFVLYPTCDHHWSINLKCHVIWINSTIHIIMAIVKGPRFQTELMLFASTSIASHTQSNHQKNEWISENSHTSSAAAPNGRTGNAKVVGALQLRYPRTLVVGVLSICHLQCDATNWWTFDNCRINPWLLFFYFISFITYICTYRHGISVGWQVDWEEAWEYMYMRGGCMKWTRTDFYEGLF